MGMLFDTDQADLYPVDRTFSADTNLVMIRKEDGQVSIEITNDTAFGWRDPEERFSVKYGHEDAKMIYQALGRALGELS